MANLVVLLIGLSLLGHTLSEHDHQRSEEVYVDYLRNDYLLTERDIWNDIASNKNLKEVIQKIHSEHSKLFFNSFVTSESLSDKRLLNGKNIIEEYVADVQLKMKRVKWNYLHNSTDPDYLKEDILAMAMQNSNATLVDRIYDSVVREDFFGYVKTIAEQQKCVKRGQTIDSANYQLFQHYNDVTKSELVAYALVQLSYMFLAAYGEKSYIEKAKILHNVFKERSKKTQDHVKELMLVANRDIWKCDLSSQTYDDPRYQITNFLEGIVDNEVNLNPDNDCKKSCSDYTTTKSYGCHEGTPCDKEPQNTKTRCNGTLYDCDFIESDMSVCFTENYSNRRYTNIVLGSGKKLGSEDCYRSATSLSSWTRWFVQCSNCFCLCDEMSENTERFFSLKEVLSDTSSNSIITGVGLFKEKGIFTWGIHQSELLNNGRVNLTKPWNAFTEVERFQPGEQVDGVDYHTLTYQHRSINLDSVLAPPGTLVTGVRFIVNNGVLNIEIRATKFEFSTGRLYNDHKWISNEHENVHRTPINLKKSDIPPKATDFSVQNVEVNKFVQFQPSGIEQDVAQTTIPFIDSQIVESFDQQAPLSGVGIYFKKSSGFGGFIAPKVITYDMTPHIGKSNF
ncbi:hypothetical protein HA402_002155 [Bradysia odoriphaga]|nr:hypothetical protein HA402_002155 [Bradysia odoriphaga]